MYKFNNFRIINYFDTSENPLGSVALCYHDDCHLLAIPSIEVGKVRIIS